MNLIKIFSILFVVSFSSLNAQINIEVTRQVSGKKFKIDITENQEKYFITLKILDSIQKNKEFEDEIEKYREEYFALTNNSVKSDSVKLIVDRMKILIEKNSSYSIFTTEIPKTDHKKFDNLINLLRTENPDFFKKKEDKNRIVLDGTVVKIEVCSEGIFKTIWSTSPDEKSHSEINNLLTSTFEIFRNKNILSTEKKITIGY